MCQWAGLEAEVEVFNLFAGSIPQEGLSRMERGRKVQSIVPDMRISIPEEGNTVPRLHELKIISSSRTRYAPHRQGQEATRAVDKRARELNQEYILKARNTDRQYCGTPLAQPDQWRSNWRDLEKLRELLWEPLARLLRTSTP